MSVVEPRSDRRTLHVVRSTLRDVRHPSPRLRSDTTQRTSPTVYFCAPDYNAPSGGIRVIYRHVDILNQAGVRAAVLHRRASFRCTWFENETRVLGSRNVMIGPDDLVVVGELHVGLVRDVGPGTRFVVFNQNPHLTWQRASAAEVERYAASPDLAAMLTVSEHSTEMLRYAAPAVEVVRLHNSLDPRRFFLGSPPARRRIAFMPRGNEEEARQVLGILRGRDLLQGWEVVALESLTEREVAEQLRETTVFLGLAYHEGFGLPAAEAMACGAYVVGFHGFAGREYFRPEFSSPVDPGDVLGLARALEQVISNEDAEPGWCRTRGEAAARYVAAEYSPQRERDEVVATYRRLMSQN